jgi:phthiocerol/phenolphthiocerol synthesis type-I polyketide synthase C
MKKRKIAIVGMSFRFPGTDASRYWTDLLNGQDFITEVESSRWAQESFRHPNKNHPGTSYTFSAGSLGDISGFDAAFFGISPREAAQMDPQQRLLLEMSWEAFENAGIAPSSVRGTQCGVFIGISSADYAYRFAEDLAAVDSTVATGNTSSIAANRISYVFDLRGPSMALDTACSSSLVAFHQACQSIQVGESALAIAGGVSLHLHPYGFIAFSKASMLSKRGRCNVFDAEGDGYVRSEGGGIFVLKDYESALADGNHILAVVAGSGVNADGKKSGLTVPSSAAQADLLRTVYERAGIAPSEIDYIEAHGTGTAVGDPIETRALGDAIGKLRAADKPLLIGSVKSNIGHLEAASGVAGMVKALHVVQKRAVPATIHIKTLNPHIKFDEWNLLVARETTPLKSTGRLVVGINSFGFGGANAHVILESAGSQNVAQLPKVPRLQEGVLLPLVISARSSAGLKANAKRYAAYLRSQKNAGLYATAYSAAFNRDWHEHRAIVFGGAPLSVANALDRFVEGSESELPVDTGTALADASPVAFVYSGNGAQWEGMGRQLLAEDAVFRQAVRAVDRVFMQYADYSLEAELTGSNGRGRYERTEIAQPALFAVQVGVTQMLRSYGMMPHAVAGHSVGEVAAAWAAGALTLEQAVQVIYHRSTLQGQTRGKGKMTAVALGRDAAGRLLEEIGLADRLAIAGVNSARGVTIAGEVSALAVLEKELAKRTTGYKRLDLDYAFHSAAMDSIESGIFQSLASLRPGEAQVQFVSTVTGGPLAGDALTAKYWWHNIRKPVLFSDAIKAMHADGVRIFVEIGPHAILRSYLNDGLKEAKLQGRVVTTLQRGDDRARRVRSALAQTLIAGAKIDWKMLFPQPSPCVDLPTYSWQRESLTHTVTPNSLQLLQRNKVHPLLGYPLVQEQGTWENQIDTAVLPMLADHVVGDAVVFPGTGFIELALAAGAQWRPGQSVDIEELEIRAPLMLDDEHTKNLRVTIDASDGSFTIRARPQLSADAWTVHATGRLPDEANDVFSERALHASLNLPSRAADFNAEEHRALTELVGLNYGDAFRAIECGWVEEGTVWAKLSRPESIAKEIDSYLLHPALLDCTFQLIIHLMRHQLDEFRGVAYVPTKIGRVLCRGKTVVPTFVRARLSRRSPHSITASFLLFDEQGVLIASVEEARFRSVRLQRHGADHLKLLGFHAVPMPLSPPPSSVFDALQPELRRACEAASSAISAQGEISLYAAEVEPLLDALTSAFAREALQQMSENGMLTRASLSRLNENNPETAPLLSRLVNVLVEDDVLGTAGNDYHFKPGEATASAQDIWNSLIADHPHRLPLINAVGRVGCNLEEILRGEKELAAVLPRDCSYPAVFAHVLGEHARGAIARAVDDVVSAAFLQLPEGQRLSVLELAEGVPQFAPLLCRTFDFSRGDYAFATSAVSIPDDCRRFQEEFPHLGVSVIPPVGDGSPSAFHETGKHDVVIVVCDFTSEESERAVLDCARRSLAGDGRLLLLTIAQARWIDFVFGGVRSWWPASLGHVQSLQHGVEHWMQRLDAMGCRDVALWPMDRGALSSPHLLVATSPARADSMISPLEAPAPTASAQQVWIAVADRSEWSRQLLTKMQAALSPRAGKLVLVDVDAVASDKIGDKTTLSTRAQRIAQQVIAARAEHGEIAGVLHLDGFNPTHEDLSAMPMLTAQETRCTVAAALMQALEEVHAKTSLWLITSGCQAALLPRRSTALHATRDAPLWGFGRSMMNEASCISVRMLDIERATTVDVMSRALVQELMAEDAESELVLSATGARYAPRLRVEPRHMVQPAKVSQSARHDTIRLGFQFPGQLRNLRWEAAPRQAILAHDIEIEVRATGLNFRDVMYALGLLSDEAVENGFAGPTLGLECAGVVTAVGDEVSEFAVSDSVVAFGPSCLGNRVVTSADAASRIPAGMSFEAAATIPGTFFTAYYALRYLARLQEGERVLIHGAAGGVGIAAIQIAKWCGAEIFVTAGSDEKRDFVRLLGADHVFDSRSNVFADQILAVTNGEGVDVVLNSLAGEAINRNLRVLKPFGRFLELGKRDFYENTKIGLRPFRNNISYFGIDADQLMSAQPALTRRLFRDVMALFEDGTLHPLPYQTFDANDVVDAFRYMQQAKQIGKIVVTYRNGIHHVHEGKADVSPLVLSESATYLVTGGLGGFGLKTAQWLVEKGARNLVLISRSGAVAAEAIAALSAFRAAGVRVHAAACDVTDEKALAALFALISTEMPPLRGVVHAAVVIEDGLVRNVTAAQIHKVFAPKILGAQHLHRMTRHMRMDFFVLFSSATTLFGNPGQASYVAANAYLETLAEARRGLGLPATCVRWGAIEDAGFLARNEAIRDALQSRMGGSALLAAEALHVLEELLVSNRSGVGVLELDWRALSRFLPTAGSPKFSELAVLSADVDPDEDHAEDIQRLMAELPPDELLATFKQMLKDEIGEILRIAPDKIDDARSLYDMGLDSLMGVELGLAIESRFGIKLPVMALSESPTIAKLAEKLIALLRATSAPKQSDEAADVAAQVRQAVSQHAADVDTKTVEEFTKDIQSGDAAQSSRMIH